MVQVLLKDKNRHILIMSRDLNKLVLDILLNINFSLSFKHRHRCVNDTPIDSCTRSVSMWVDSCKDSYFTAGEWNG